MHPQVFLKTFWRMELRSQIFVAMSFDPKYISRFNDVIAPAIRSISVDGAALEPYRVDLSKTGDSVLTDINDGIAHSLMVLADISSIGKDSITGEPYRNSNVMYEVGLALACRQSSEVLLVRDDRDKLLFDVSTIPHMTIDFTNPSKATSELREALISRLNERDFVNDARVRLAVATLSSEEATLLKELATLSQDTVWGRDSQTLFDALRSIGGISRLLDKQILIVAGEFDQTFPAYKLTPLGHVIARVVKSELRQFKAEPPIAEDNTK